MYIAIDGSCQRDILGEKWYQVVRYYIEEALAGRKVVFEISREYNGGIQYLKTSYIPDQDENGDTHGFYVMAQDITELKTVQLALEHDVLHDSLTNLPNPYALMNQMESAFERAKRSRKAFAVMFLDVDKFKQFNDTFDHQVGDKVLIEFARRLQGCVRHSDTVARLGGDEFVILMENLTNGLNDVYLVAEKILAELSHPMVIGEIVQTISTSIGIALYEQDVETADQLLQRAEKAIYEAKRAGRNRIASFNVATMAAPDLGLAAT